MIVKTLAFCLPSTTSHAGFHAALNKLQRLHGEERAAVAAACAFGAASHGSRWIVCRGERQWLLAGGVAALQAALRQGSIGLGGKGLYDCSLSTTIMPVIELKQTETFAKWEGRLRDKRAKTLIATLLARLAHGLPGDVKSVGEGVSELRIQYGPGFRVYYIQRGAVLIVLLCGGDKKTQDADIATAKKLAKEME